MAVPRRASRRPAGRAGRRVLPRMTSALRRSQRGSRPAMYQRPWRSSSVVVVRGEQVEHVDPRLGVGRQRPAVAPPEVDGRRARLLAVVAAVQAVADRRTELDRDGTRALQHPGEAAVGVDDARAPRWRPSGRRRGTGGTCRSRRRRARRRPGSAAVVITQPSTNQLPAPGSSRLAFLPNQPSPARWATSRSTIALSSANATARSSAARSRRAIARSPSRSGCVVVDPGVAGDARRDAVGGAGRLGVGEVATAPPPGPNGHQPRPGTDPSSDPGRGT